MFDYTLVCSLLLIVTKSCNFFFVLLTLHFYFQGQRCESRVGDSIWVMGQTLSWNNKHEDSGNILSICSYLKNKWPSFAMQNSTCWNVINYSCLGYLVILEAKQILFDRFLYSLFNLAVIRAWGGMVCETVECKRKNCFSDLFGSVWIHLHWVNFVLHSEISGAHSGEYEDDCLVGCCTM
jgi:hypothetical protein